MLFLRLCLSLLCALWFCLASAPRASAADSRSGTAIKQLHCWRLEQKNVFFGDCTVYACSEALNVVFKSGRWIDLARAPDWELYVLNPREKVYSHTPIDKWKATTIRFGLLNTEDARLVRTCHFQQIGGLWAVELLPQSSLRHKSNGSYWVARDLHLPEPICKVLCGNAFISKLNTLPLRICQNTASVQNSVDTISSAQVDLPATFFDLPKGYKQTNHPEDVMNTGVMDIVKDMADF